MFKVQGEIAMEMRETAEREERGRAEREREKRRMNHVHFVDLSFESDPTRQ